ncbi:TAXI family TRAP transporter solute-binding subunit, partial [Sneathiella sp.]|uniref:TAXI family TRAP transporter solute-binding subunit n=1 Tax=Sneathiella sp. TaxID=1964365 RepID=UPI00356970B0
MRNSVKLLTKLTAVATALYLATVGIVNAQQLDMVSGSVGGGYFKAAAALSEYVAQELPNTRIIVRPGTSWANVDQLDSGSADLAVIENVLGTLAWQGKSPTGDKYDFR